MNYEIENLINLYLDGELEKDKEQTLFDQLAKNEEARDSFKQLRNLKLELQHTMEEYPVSLERKIFSSIQYEKNKTPWYRQLFPIISYSFAVILLLVSLLLYFEMREFKSEIQLASHQIIDQQKTINLLINSLSPVEIETDLINAVIVKANL